MKFAIVLLYFITRSILSLADPCADMIWSPSGYGFKVTSVSQAVACVSQYPYTDKVKNDTLAAIIKFTQLNVFDDSDKNSGAPFNINADVFGELNRISGTVYPNDYQLQRDVSVSVRKSKNGAHHFYRKGSCYRFFAYQPFDMALDSSGKVYTRGFQNVDNYPFNGFLANDMKAMYGIDPSQFRQSTIEKINGVDAYTYFVNWAQNDYHQSGARDSEVRLNFAIKTSNFNPWSCQGLQQFELPDSDTVNYQFLLPNGTRATVDLPWMVVFYGNYQYGVDTSYQTLYRQCLPDSKRDAEEEVEVKEKKQTTPPSPHDFVPEVPFTSRSAVPSDNVQETESNKLRTAALKEEFVKRQGFIMDDGFVGCYYLGNAGFIFLNSFNLAPANFLADLNTCSAGYNSLQITSLFIIVTNNLGGFVCDAELFAHWVSPQISYLDETEMDSRWSEYMSAANTYNDMFRPLTEDFASASFYNVTTEQQFQNMDWYNNGPILTRAGSSSRYSNKFHWKPTSCTSLKSQVVPLLPLPNDAVFFVTDGTCGSACAITLLFLQTHGQVTVLGLGGLVNTTSIDSVAYPDGRSEVLSNEYYYSTIYDLLSGGQFRRTYGNDILLPLPHVGADYMVTYWEVYNWYKSATGTTSSTVTQTTAYTRWPSDYKIPFWDFGDLFGMVMSVIPYAPGPKPDCTNFFQPQNCRGRNLFFPGYTGLYTVSFDQYDIISFDSLTSSSGNLAGRVAVRNNLNIGSISVGTGLAYLNARNPATILVGKDATFSSGSLSPSGSVAYVGGNYNAPAYLKNRQLNAGYNCSGCLDKYFDLAQQCYVSFAGHYASQTPNANITLLWGSTLQVRCQSNSAQTYFIQVSSTTLNAGNNYQFQNCNPAATYVLTLTGTGNVVFQGGAFPSSAKRVLYNVPGVRSVTVNTGVYGSILAPQATFTQSNGNVNGKVVAGNIAQIRTQQSVCQI